MTREKLVDCRGLACPNPVLRAKEVVEAGGVEALTVLVDNPAAQENVRRFLERAGFEVQVSPAPGGFAVAGRRGVSLPEAAAVPEREEKILVLVGTDRLGRGDDELGGKLMANFLATLPEMGDNLWTLVLVNAGVKLAVAGSPVLASLSRLATAGVQVLVCGTCLQHFGLLEQKAVGETTNMLDIVTHLQMADKVITFS
ncbi:MAG: sulfurtransferase-like selenium metabolism protein YedF [Syntrophobacterales bacterium]|jgi:selenium metabolism protein YedF|nr:sulfurtransferase-like selenium metabolism protein YedF [Syntrophobacterales bacterium]